MSLYISSPRGQVVDASFQRCRIAYHFVQHADNIRELWPCVPVFLPTVQHQLVQYYWTVHGSWKPEVLFYSIYHLGHVEERRKNLFKISLVCISFYKADKIMSLYIWKGFNIVTNPQWISSDCSSPQPYRGFVSFISEVILEKKLQKSTVRYLSSTKLNFICIAPLSL